MNRPDEVRFRWYAAKRAAKLYLGGGALFACRLCHCLGYRSQLQNPQCRAIAKARKFRMLLGGNPNLLDPFPGSPARMHRRTYGRLQAAALATEERMVALELDWLCTCYRVTLGPPLG
jgi:hypothetical protein